MVQNLQSQLSVSLYLSMFKLTPLVNLQSKSSFFIGVKRFPLVTFEKKSFWTIVCFFLEHKYLNISKVSE